MTNLCVEALSLLDSSPVSQFGAGVGLSQFVGIPSVPDGTLMRARLLDRMNRNARLTVLSGPAGLGKTTLAAQWATAVGSSRTGLWVTLSSRDRTPAGLWSRLLVELSAAGWLQSSTHPEAGPHAPGHTSVHPSVAERDDVLGILSRLVDHRTLVLDNLELISPDAVAELITVIDAQPLIDWVLLTRETGLLRRSGRQLADINLIGADELALTDDEFAEILRPLTELAPYDQLLTSVGRLPLAAGTAVVAYQQSADLFDPAVAQAGSRLSWILASLPGVSGNAGGRDDQFVEFADFLAETSVASTVDPWLAAELTMLPVSRSQYYLVRAVELGFGTWETTQVGRGPLAFRYAAGIRQTLYQEFRLRSPEGVREAHRRLAEWAERNGLWVAAVEAWLEISDLDAANRAVSTHFGDLIGPGSAEAGKLSVPTDPEQLRNYPFLAVAAAVACRARGTCRKRTSQGLLELAVDEAKRQKAHADAAERMLLAAVETAVPRLLGDLETAHRSSLSAAATVSSQLHGHYGQLSEAAAEAVQQTLTTLIRAADVRTAESILSEPYLLPGHTGRPYTDFQLSSMAAAIQALSGEVHAAREALRCIDQSWPEEWRVGPGSRFYGLARLVVAVETLDFDEVRCQMGAAGAEAGTAEMPLYWGSYEGLSYLAQNQPGSCYERITEIIDDPIGTSVAPLDRNVLDGYRSLALYCQGETERAEALMRPLDPRVASTSTTALTPWPPLVQATWSLATGRPGRTLEILEEIAGRLPLAPDAIFERHWPFHSAALRAAAHLRLGHDKLALAEFGRLSHQLVSTGRRLPLAFMPSQDLTDLVELATAAGHHPPVEVIGDVSRLPGVLG